MAQVRRRQFLTAAAGFIDKALAVGTIEPLVEVSVKSKLSGVVKARFAEVGDFVKAGDPLMDVYSPMVVSALTRPPV